MIVTSAAEEADGIVGRDVAFTERGKVLLKLHLREGFGNFQRAAQAIRFGNRVEEFGDRTGADRFEHGLLVGRRIQDIRHCHPPDRRKWAVIIRPNVALPTFYESQFERRAEDFGVSVYLWNARANTASPANVRR